LGDGVDDVRGRRAIGVDQPHRFWIRVAGVRSAPGWFEPGPLGGPLGLDLADHRGGPVAVGVATRRRVVPHFGVCVQGVQFVEVGRDDRIQWSSN
jgi:hypothetical protein